MPLSPPVIQSALKNGTAQMAHNYLQEFGPDAHMMTPRQAVEMIAAAQTGGASRDAKAMLKMMAESPWTLTTGIHRTTPQEGSSAAVDRTRHFTVELRRTRYHCRLRSKADVIFEISCGEGGIGGKQFYQGPGQEAAPRKRKTTAV